MATLKFSGNDLKAVFQGAKTSGKPVSFVKDEGIYICVHVDKKAIVCYANGFDPAKVDRRELYDKCRTAVGGDDFVEKVPTTPKFLEALVMDGAMLSIGVTGTKLSFSVSVPLPQADLRKQLEASFKKNGYTLVEWKSDQHVVLHHDAKNTVCEFKARGRKWVAVR